MEPVLNFMKTSRRKLALQAQAEGPRLLLAGSALLIVGLLMNPSAPKLGPQEIVSTASISDSAAPSKKSKSLSKQAHQRFVSGPLSQ